MRDSELLGSVREMRRRMERIGRKERKTALFRSSALCGFFTCAENVNTVYWVIADNSESDLWYEAGRCIPDAARQQIW